MDVFEYLPQLIVAYDGNNEFANLIHISKANKDNEYLCPCCGGSVKPRALDSTKEQSHYYHISGKCTKESQLHFFCKNWLFEVGSQFYVNDNLYEVESIDIEKSWDTQFGHYVPDITVYTTSGKIIFFEMFFSNRKTGDDYFCKWDELGNDVVEVNIKEYMIKTDADVIPSFTYLYHDGVCYSKSYQKKDLYANTIAKIKRELTRQKVLNYKARIEQLDWFWQKVRNNATKESILETLSAMDYEDLTSCYEIIKRKQCVSYLKSDVLDMINQKVISEVRKSLEIPCDENVYFDLKYLRGRTYEAGIRINIKTDHIIYDDIYESYNEDIINIKGFPKIVFSGNMFSLQELIVPEREIENLKQKFEEAKVYKEKLIAYEKELSDLEGSYYKIRMKNNLYTVLAKIQDDDFEVIMENYYLKDLSTKRLFEDIESQITERNNQKYINVILGDERYIEKINMLKNYKHMNCDVNIEYNNWNMPGIHFKLILGNQIIYDEIMEPNFDSFAHNVNCSKAIIKELYNKCSILNNLVDKINECKNKFWKADINFNNDKVTIKIDQTIFEVKKHYLSTYEKICFYNTKSYTEDQIKDRIRNAMKCVLENMERCGYRVMEVCD